VCGRSGGELIVLGETLADDDAFRGDFVFADLFAVIAAAHFDHHEYFSQFASDFDVAKANDVVGEEGVGVRAEVVSVAAAVFLDFSAFPLS
jgi:hypothetical protein